MHVKWLDKPEQHDYQAAADYLSLITEPAEAVMAARRLEASDTILHGKAKDILRASRLLLLPKHNAHVHRDLTKIEDGTPLSPILLVRGDHGLNLPLQIADGYHRVCASYYVDENTDIPYKITDW